MDKKQICGYCNEEVFDGHSHVVCIALKTKFIKHHRSLHKGDSKDDNLYIGFVAGLEMGRMESDLKEFAKEENAWVKKGGKSE